MDLGNAEEELCLKAIQTLSRLDLSRTASLDPTDGQSFAALGCTGNYDKSEQMMMIVNDGGTKDDKPKLLPSS